jgi:hypothetical protein
MIRKFLLCASLTGALVLGGAILTRPAGAQSQTSQPQAEQPQAEQPQAEQPQTGQTPTGKQTQQATKSVTGKVAAIGTGGHSFTLEITGGSGDAHTMNFVADNNTQVQGQVRQGTPVTVEYLIVEGGQNLAVSITAQA